VGSVAHTRPVENPGGAHDPKEVVRAGYDAASHLYRKDGDDPAEYTPWLDDLERRLPERSSVLDVGCGCGIPVARRLVAAGHDVTGVDLSEVQIERAGQLVPEGRFVHADAATLELRADSLDAVVCLYTLIHIPRDDQRALIRSFATWLRPHGVLLAVVGAHDLTGQQQNWLGGGAPMWWSHPPADTYRRWFIDAGFSIDVDTFVPEGDAGHQLLLAIAP
jgi:SAM-dependent methyltransferase